MLDALVAVVALLLVVAGVLIIVGPRQAVARLRALGRPDRLTSVFVAQPPQQVAAPSVNPKTQRVLTAAARLASWLRTHGQDEAARAVRGAAARVAGNEAAGLYALQETMRRIRVVNVTDSAAQERLTALVTELRSAVQDRFEQLELLPFRRPRT